MSESMSSPWIRNYLVDVAETYGAQSYNAPVTKGKKKVQLTDFLTYQENSYVWAWISDKDHRVSVRISKDAADNYKREHGRNVVDCRFCLVFIASYRPMFSPRPLGPNVVGNTSVSHISLEIGYIFPLGIGTHLFGKPRDLESDEKMKEWVLGLRQDDGGGNVLKLRKQQEQNKKAPPSPPSFSLYAPVSGCQTTKPAGDAVRLISERPQDLKRAYTKRWRKAELNQWKLAKKPAPEERPNSTESNHSLADSLVKSRSGAPNPRTPSPNPLQRQGTPTNWSPSNRGSPATPDEAITVTSGNENQQDNEPDVVPPASHPLFDIERRGAADTTFVSDVQSLQPPMPAQRIKRSPPPSSPPLRSSPEVSIRTPLPSKQLPHSSPPLPLSSPPPLSSSLLIPISIRKDIRRKVPHPGSPIPRSDPTKQGPIQILVPNSDTSGTGSSQSYSQSQLFSQSQRWQPEPLSHPLAIPSSVTKMFAGSLPNNGDTDNQETTAINGEFISGKADINIGKQEMQDSMQLPSPSAPKIEVLEVGTSDTEEEIDELNFTHSMETRFGTRATIQDASERDVNLVHGDSQLSDDDADIHSVLKSPPPELAAVSGTLHPPSADRDSDNNPTHLLAALPDLPASQGSMHSLFSAAWKDEQSVPCEPSGLPIGLDEEQEAGPVQVPRHDPEAWKEPSFIGKNKGKARAVDEPDTPSVRSSKKRWRSGSARPESLMPKRIKVAQAEVRQVAAGQTAGSPPHTRHRDTETSALENLPSPSRTDTTATAAPHLALQLRKPRLANFAVDFERVNLGRKVPITRLNLDRDIKGTLLRTGTIRALGEKVEKDGSVYMHS